MRTPAPIPFPRRAAVDHAPVAGRAAAARGWVLLAYAACLAAHVWLISAGRWTAWPQYTDRYHLLAGAFAAGQTHLVLAPDPRHLALPDPYDPAANQPFRARPGVHDTCLYDGKFYLYWGPVPALMLTPAALAIGPGAAVGDQVLCFGFAQGLLGVTAALLLRARRRHFPGSPAYVPAVGLLVAGLSAPITCVLTRAAVYEVAIVGGQFFLLAGILLAWRAAPGRRLPLAAAGACLAAAVGCRVSLAVAVVGVALLVVGRLMLARRRDRGGRVFASLVVFGLPLVAGAAALAAYNHVRFGAWHQFGQPYQLAGANLRSYPALFGVANLWPGLWSYACRPVALIHHFPYLLPLSGDGTFPSFIQLPSHYESYDPITGLLWVMPFLWLLAMSVVWARRSGATDAGLVPERPGEEEDGRPGAGWLLAALATAAALGFAPVLLMIGSSQRYLADLTPSLTIVATLTLFRLTDRWLVPARSANRRLAAGVALAGLTVAAGLLLAIEGYAGHFRLNNPDLYRTLTGGRTQPAAAAHPAPENTHHADA